MAEVAQYQPMSAGCPTSFRNAPQAAKITQTIGGAMSGYGVPIAVPSPAIEQLYDPSDVKHLPGKAPPKGKGQFVNWGTKLYELELELSYKNNEIVVLKRRLKKVTDQLYPGGNTDKKSVIVTLRTHNEVIQKKLQTKERQLNYEQKRCQGLEHDLSQAKKENLQLRKQNLFKEKAVQTLPINHESTQVSSSVPQNTKTRTVMTQCTPTLLKVSNTTRFAPRHDIRESKRSTAQRAIYHRKAEVNSSSHSSSTSFISTSPYASLTNVTTKFTPRPNEETVTVENKVKVKMIPHDMSGTKSPDETSSLVLHRQDQPDNHFILSKPGVKFATSMTITENAERANEIKDPLEMSITQEFDKENSVKTVVQSNRDFEIKQKPIMLSNTGQAMIGVEHVSRPDCLKLANHSRDGDSGLGSYSDHDSTASYFRPNHTTVYSHQTGKVSYKQILDGVSPFSQEGDNDKTGRVFERDVHEYMQPAYYPPSYSTSAKRNTQFNTKAWEIYNRGSVRANPTGVAPYYLFKRSHENIARNKTHEKPIFVHVSEIAMHR